MSKNLNKEKVVLNLQIFITLYFIIFFKYKELTNKNKVNKFFKESQNGLKIKIIKIPPSRMSILLQ